MTEREETENLIAKLLRKRKDKFEALAWLKGGTAQSKRYLAELTNHQSVRLIKRAYDAGVVEVWAVGFARNAPYESIYRLVITLPEDRVKRKATFKWANEQIERQGFEPESDYGQRHLYIWFD